MPDDRPNTDLAHGVPPIAVSIDLDAGEPDRVVEVHPPDLPGQGRALQRGLPGRHRHRGRA